MRRIKTTTSPTKPVRGAIIEASYKHAEIEHYKGNPLIETLPPLADEISVLRAFGRFPAITPSEKRLRPTLRMASVGRLRSYLEPLPRHGELFSEIGWIVREGYAHRNPADEDYVRRVTASYHKAMSGEVCPISETGCSTAPCIGLFGLSGVGKSSAIDRVLSFLPQVAIHRKSGFAQVVWMKLDCPPDGSLKQFLISILGELDELLDSTYVRSSRDTTVDGLIPMVGKIARMHHLGVLVIDEIQHLVGAKSESVKKLLNFLVTFSNVVQIPVVISGTLGAKTLLESHFKFARRFSDSGAVVWGRLEGEEWAFFLEGLLKFQWTKWAAEQSEISDALYDETQGIHALAVRLFQLCQIDAIRTGSESVTSEQIRRVAKAKFCLMRRSLKSFRSGQQRRNMDAELGQGIAALDTEIDSYRGLEGAGSPKRGVSNDRLERDRAIASLLTLMDLDERTVEKLVDDIVRVQPNIRASALVQSIVASFDADGNSGPRENRTMADIVSTSDREGAAGHVEALRASGIIKEVNGHDRNLSAEALSR
jgi:hypothetical protein